MAQEGDVAAGAPAHVLDRVKDEIEFFMEKTFQVSFGYLGALVAIGAAANLDLIDGASGLLKLTAVPFVASAVLAVNATYLSIAAGTLFATLKRGLFLIQQDADGNSHRRWETFLRDGTHSPFFGRRFGSLRWNVDNFYMVPMFVLIAIASVACFAVGIGEAQHAFDYTVLGLGVAIHFLPVAMLVSAAKLVERADELVQAGDVESMAQPAS